MDSIFKSLQGFCETFYKNWHAEKQQMFTEYNAGIKQSVTTALNQIDTTHPASEILISLWDGLVILLEKIQQEAQFNSFAEFEEKEILNHWSKFFNQSLQALPSTVQIPLAPEFWKMDPSDGLRVRIQKQIKRVQTRVSEKTVRVMNRFRRTPVELPVRQRVFPLPDFAHFYVALSFSGFIIQEWERYLQFMRTSLHTVRGLIKEIGSSMIYFEAGEASWQAPDSDEIRLSIDSCLKKLKDLDALDLSLASFFTDSLGRFEQWTLRESESWAQNGSRAGTILLPNKRFGRHQIQLKNRFIRKGFLQKREPWINHLVNEEEDWREEIYLFQLIFKTGAQCLKTIATIHQDLTTQLIPEFHQAEEAITESVSLIQGSAGQADEETMKNSLRKESFSLNRSLKRQLLPSLADRLLSNRSVPAITEFLDYSQAAVGQLPEKMRVYQVKDMTQIPPNSEMVELPIRDLVEKQILIKFKTGADKLLAELNETLETALIRVSEIEQIVSFTGESALKLLEADAFDPEATRTAVDGLGRAVEKISSLVADLRNATTETGSGLIQQTRSFIQEIENLIHNEKLIQLHFQIVRTQLKHRFLNLRRSLWARMTTAVRSGWTIVVHSLAWVKGRMQKVKVVTGFADEIDNSEEKLQRQLAQTWQTIETLPYIYVRLFSLEPLVDDQFFAQRETEMAQLQADFSLWSNNQYMITAVIGERGAGKTTLVNMAEKRIYSDLPTVWIHAARVDATVERFLKLFREIFTDFNGSSFSDLEVYLAALKKPTVCVIKKLHLLFLKTIDGFDLIEQLLLLMNRTSKKVYWIVTCNQHSWDYLNRVIGIGSHFPSIIQFSSMTGSELEDVILRRHKVTGYKLLFQADRKIQANRRYKKATTEPDRQKIISDIFFKQLQESAQGNITMAILFWLLSIRKIDRNRLIMNAHIDLDYLFLNQLSQSELFSLGSLVQHEILSEADHARIFLQNEIKSRQQLKILANKAILVEDPPGQFKVNLAIYRPLVQLLKRNKILY